MTPHHLNLISDDQLLQGYSDLLEAVALWKDRLGRQEWEIRKRVESRGATAIPSDTFICEVVPKAVYDHTRFTPLKEILSESDLAVCWREEHPETVMVPEKWNTVKAKAAARRYGAEAQAVVESAITLMPGALKFEAKDVKKVQ